MLVGVSGVMSMLGALGMRFVSGGPAGLLSLVERQSGGCASFFCAQYFSMSSGALIFFVAIHVDSSSGYPFHLTSSCGDCRWTRSLSISSTSYSGSSLCLSMLSGGGLSGCRCGNLSVSFGSYFLRSLVLKLGCIFVSVGRSRVYTFC